MKYGAVRKFSRDYWDASILWQLLSNVAHRLEVRTATVFISLYIGDCCLYLVSEFLFPFIGFKINRCSVDHGQNYDC